MATTVTLKPNAIDISGSTSGTTTLQATAVAGTTTITLPAATDTLVGKATTDTLTNKTLTGAVMNGTVGATTPSTGAFTTLSATGVTTVQAGTAAAPAITTTGDTNTGIFFPAADTIAFAEGGAEAMRIDSSGNVGIGTTTPSVKFQVNHSSDVAAINATGGGVTLKMSNSSANDVLLRMTNNSNNFYDIRNLTSGSAFTIGYNGDERMRIDSSGNVNIGLTGASNRLAVYGPEATMLVRCSTITDGTGRTIIGFQSNAGSGIGSISGNTSSTSYNTSSDYRLKQNIAPMTGALAKVAALKPVTYKWKLDGSDGEGFIAHELAEVCSHAVTGGKDAVDEDGNPKYQGIDTSFLVATLTAAIQEQQALITSLTTRIAALEAA